MTISVDQTDQAADFATGTRVFCHLYSQWHSDSCLLAAATAATRPRCCLVVRCIKRRHHQGAWLDDLEAGYAEERAVYVPKSGSWTHKYTMKKIIGLVAGYQLMASAGAAACTA